MAGINLSAEPGREAIIESVDVEELSDRHGRPAGSKVIPPDAPPLRPLPAKRTEPDPVAVAAARVAEKWQQLEQLDSRRVETGADLESEMQGVFQEGQDITTETFGEISDRVIFEVKVRWVCSSGLSSGSPKALSSDPVRSVTSWCLCTTTLRPRWVGMDRVQGD